MVLVTGFDRFVSYAYAGGTNLALCAEWLRGVCVADAARPATARRRAGCALYLPARPPSRWRPVDATPCLPPRVCRPHRRPGGLRRRHDAPAGRPHAAATQAPTCRASSPVTCPPRRTPGWTCRATPTPSWWASCPITAPSRAATRWWSAGPTSTRGIEARFADSLVQPRDTVVTDSRRLTVRPPAGRPGMADVAVELNGRRAVLPGAYRYDSHLRRARGRAPSRAARASP
jgi:hypothetical protein